MNAITGLGHTFISDTAKAKFLRSVIGADLAHMSPIGRSRHCCWCRTRTTPRCLRPSISPASGSRSFRAPASTSSGCNRSRSRAGPITVGFVGRLLDDKGIRTLVAAHRLLRSERPADRLPDRRNARSRQSNFGAAGGASASGGASRALPGSATSATSRRMGAGAYRGAALARREGVPKSLLEAAACGRPMIATDVPGCREIVIPGDTGILVPPDDVDRARGGDRETRAIAELRIRLGGGARRLVEARFSADAIGRATVDLYRRLADKAS